MPPTPTPPAGAVRSLDDAPWSLEIKPRAGLLEVNLAEVWRYRDLIMLFVRRDLVSAYKQTILGPLWFVLQPLFTTAAFTIVFSRIAQLSTDGVPPVIFYLSGLVCWGFFSSSLVKTSGSLISNAHIFGKVYFPRLAVPLSGVISNVVTFGAQLGLFLILYVYYLITMPGAINPTWQGLALLPLVLVLVAAMGLGLGLIIASVSTRFRDLQFFLGFGVQLLMYATPVIYPLASVPAQWRWLVLANPMAPLVELFRYAFLGAGTFSWGLLAYSCGMTGLLVGIGVLAFNQVERTFMDTV